MYHRSRPASPYEPGPILNDCSESKGKISSTNTKAASITSALPSSLSSPPSKQRKRRKGITTKHQAPHTISQSDQSRSIDQSVLRKPSKRRSLFNFRAADSLAQLSTYLNKYRSCNSFRKRIVYDRVALDTSNHGSEETLCCCGQGTCDHLQFESRFESGNLCKAIQVSENEYDLLLSHDINTHGRTQWFFFQVKNAKPNTKYKLNMINMEKKTSGFNKGMVPIIFSEARLNATGYGWRRSRVDDIIYHPNHWLKVRPDDIGSLVPKFVSNANDEDNSDDEEGEKPSSSNEGTENEWFDIGNHYFTLAMTLSLTEYPDDTVYLSHFYPYTLTRHLNFMKNLTETSPDCIIRQKLCTTLGGNICELVTITDLDASPAAIAQRPVILLSSRVHPGE